MLTLRFVQFVDFLACRQIYQPRGKVWGGSSSLNAMVYIRGHAYDYDRWEKEGAKGWSYADCLPYFRKSQTHELGEILPGLETYVSNLK